VNGRYIILAGTWFDQQGGWVASDADEEKDGQRQQQQRKERVAKPPQDELPHANAPKRSSA
jgi:hypothetical protein